ncbi:conserved hypothetical protein [Lodderomyces elongisporus NRRL YB-4239]|uniref:3-hydroxyisobutyrate dehydrogenase n=1 Tax=Lodderomyces elongisporus (strain ATCC 11503 / CBS 2605 / JCM 1781 / NBRC 1676 / NRRL YB-4239) TaxID=379508 RepID=A5E5L9_LODEL|nr:conserved hypothetical protein [Lodderomyces elongisporus NRRL YB-4239]
MHKMLRSTLKSTVRTSGFLATKLQNNFSTQSTNLAAYGFIGLGQMGQHMARHIYENLDEGDTLYVYDTNPVAAANFVETVTTQTPQNNEKLKVYPDLKSFTDLGNEALDFIATMVPEGKHVKAVVEELVENAAANGNPNYQTTIIDSSTIDIPTSRAVHEYVKLKLPNFDFIDAPVSGGVAGARKGTLSFMLSRNTHEDVSPALTTLLNKMGKNIFPCGAQHGTGLAAKLSNNYLLAITNLATADSFQLAKAFGLNLQNYAKLVAVSTGKSWASVDNCPIEGVYPENNLPADVGFQGGFITKLTRKDVVLATDCAKEQNRFLFLGDIGRQWYDKACEREDIAQRDLGVLYEWLGDLEQRPNGDIVDVKQ